MDEGLRPTSENRRSPSSPGKRRMVDNEKVRLISRGLPDSDEEEQIVINPNPPQFIPNTSTAAFGAPYPKDNRTLNLTASRKRKALEPSTSEQTVLVLPSPTTQIAHQIDSIRLVGTPVYGGGARLPTMLGQPESTSTRMDHQPPSTIPREDSSNSSSSTTSITASMDTLSSVTNKHGDIQNAEKVIGSMLSTSPRRIPEIFDDPSMMEAYMSMQQQVNMKRTMTDVDNDDAADDDGEPHSEGGDVVNRTRGRKEKMIKYSHTSAPPNSSSSSSASKTPPISTTPPIRVSTIVHSPTKGTSLSPPTNSSLVYPQVSKSVGFVVGTPVTMSTQTDIGAGAPLSSLSILPTIPPVSNNPPSSFPSSPNPSQPSASKPSTSKISNFSISELLAKDDSKSKPSKPVLPQHHFPPVPPSFFAMYYQQWYMQMLSGMKKFQGEAAETDSGPIRPPLSGSSTISTSSASSLVIPERDKLTSPGSGSGGGGNDSRIHSPSTDAMQSPASLISINSSNSPSQGDSNGGGVERQGVKETPLPATTNRLVESVAQSSSSSNTSQTGNERTDDRQNALLQVGEAHLAILPDEDGDTPLHLSIIQENIPLTFYLVRLISGVRMNLDIANNLRQTPLHLSIITRQPMLTQLLVQNGASVNFPDRRGNTCIHLAAQRKNLDALQILSQATSPLPDYNCRNFAGLTPVHLATKEGSVDVLKFLFQKGANKNCAESCSGRTPLHYAIESQNLEVCNYLLENGCNVNSVTFSGNTPLHVAAGRRLKEIVAVLMAYGANPAIANGEGDFPSDLPASLLMQRAKMNTR